MAFVTKDVVLLVLFDEQGRFLLQHRDKAAPMYPEFWGFFGGTIEPGESLVAALRREAFEELRYRPLSVEPVIVRKYTDSISKRCGTRYYFSEFCSDVAGLELHEGQGMGWFHPHETEQIRCTRGNRGILEQLAKTQKAKSFAPK